MHDAIHHQWSFLDSFSRIIDYYGSLRFKTVLQNRRLFMVAVDSESTFVKLTLTLKHDHRSKKKQDDDFTAAVKQNL